MELATESMVRATEEATMRHGIDPSQAAFVGGGGASGFNAVQLARRLGCRKVVFPGCSPVLSAFGMTIAAPSAEARCVLLMRSDAYDGEFVASRMARLFREAEGYIPHELRDGADLWAEYFVSAKYEGQVWELDIAVPEQELANIEYLVQAFHARHTDVYSFYDADALVEFLSWRSRAIVSRAADSPPNAAESAPAPVERREVFLEGKGYSPIQVHLFRRGAKISGSGPAIVESDYTTIFVEGGDRFISNDAGDLEVSLSENLSQSFDGGELAIMAARLDAIARRMASVLLRTGRSGVLNRAKDLSCCIVSADHELVCTADSLPIHVLSGPDLMARSLFALHNDIRPGDAFLNNSPYHG